MPAPGKSGLIDISAEVKGESDKAFRLYDGAKTQYYTSRTKIML